MNKVSASKVFFTPMLENLLEQNKRDAFGIYLLCFVTFGITCVASAGLAQSLHKSLWAGAGIGFAICLTLVWLGAIVRGKPLHVVLRQATAHISKVILIEGPCGELSTILVDNRNQYTYANLSQQSARRLAGIHSKQAEEYSLEDYDFSHTYTFESTDGKRSVGMRVVIGYSDQIDLIDICEAGGWDGSEAAEMAVPKLLEKVASQIPPAGASAVELSEFQTALEMEAANAYLKHDIPVTPGDPMVIKRLFVLSVG